MSVIERAPWRDILPDGSLSATEYLPTSTRTGRQVSHDRADREYLQRYGSLRAVPNVPDDQPEPPPEQQDPPALYDQQFMINWGRANSHRLSDRELAVYVRYWENRRSVSECAESLQISKDYVRDLIKRIRRKAGVVRPI